MYILRSGIIINNIEWIHWINQVEIWPKLKVYETFWRKEYQIYVLFGFYLGHISIRRLWLQFYV